MQINEPRTVLKENNGILYLTASVFLVILCFFVLMNAISIKNHEKTGAIANAVQEEFSKKGFKEKILVFEKRKYEQDIGTASTSFKDIMNSFLTVQEVDISADMGEDKNNYILTTAITGFFATERAVVRPPAERFINSLNNYIDLNRTGTKATAKLVLFYDQNDATATDLALNRLVELYTLLDYQQRRRIDFSVAPLGEKDGGTERRDKITILFSKDDF